MKDLARKGCMGYVVSYGVQMDEVNKTKLVCDVKWRGDWGVKGAWDIFRLAFN